MTVPAVESSVAQPSELSRRLRSLKDISRAVNSTREPESILAAIVEAICRHSGWATSSIMSVDFDAAVSILIASYDPYSSPEDKRECRWALDTSPTMDATLEQRTVVIDDAQISTKYPGYRQDSLRRGYHTAVLVPLRADDWLGRPMVLSVAANETIPVGDDDLAFLETAAHQASIAVRNAKRIADERRWSQRLANALDTQGRLMSQVLNDASFAEVFASIEAILSRPLVAIDGTSNVVTVGRSPCPDGLSDEEWREYVQETARATFLPLVENIPNQTGRRQVIDVAPTGERLSLSVLIEPLHIDGQLVGGMLVFDEPPEPDELDELIVGTVKFALSVKLMRGYVRFRSEADLRADLLRELFDGTWSDADVLATRAGHLGLDLNAPSTMLLLAAAGVAGPSHTVLQRLLEGVAAQVIARSRVIADRNGFVILVQGEIDGAGRQVRRLAGRLIEECEGVAAQVIARSRVIADRNGFVILVQGEIDGAGRQVRRLAGRLIEECEWLGVPDAIAVLGPTVKEVEGYPAARETCSRVLTLARAASRTGVVSLSEFGPATFLLAAAGGDAARSFVTEWLSPILEYDQGHHARLEETLTSYLRSGGRPTACAAALDIHVSTLLYRMKRIEKLLVVDLRDPDSRFTLELALSLRALLNVNGS